MNKLANSSVVNPRYAKSKGYRDVIDTIQNIGKCPFCPDNFKYHKEPILKKLNGWFITKSSWPYKNSQKHFLIISPVHKENLAQLTFKDINSVLSLSKWATKEFEIKGGALTLRFGDTNFTGATVSHLHAHLIYPAKGRGKHSKTVNFPIG